MNRSLADNADPVVAQVYDIANCGPRNQFVANGRLVHNSGGDKLNFQNLPVRGDTTLRRALKAPVGQMLISCDLSQIEARILAWVAGQVDLVEAFRDKRDVYSEFASEIYGRRITKADVAERDVGKRGILGLGYGMGAEKFGNDDAAQIVRLYRQKNWKIVQFWQKCNNALRDMLYGGSNELHPQIRYDSKGIRLPNGFYIQYPLLRETADGFSYKQKTAWAKVYGSKVTENLVQALAALVIREQMLEVGKYFKVVLQVHDELVITVPEANVLADQAKFEALMTVSPSWALDLPIACESGVAANYGDT